MDYIIPYITWPQSWSELVFYAGVAGVLLALLGLVYWFEKRRQRKGLREFPGLCKTLRGIGVNATLKDTDEAGASMKPEDFDIVEGTWQFIEFQDSNIDFACFFSDSSRLRWIVKPARPEGTRDITVTFLDKRFTSSLWFGVLADVVWEGDDYLAATLNADRPLRARLLNAVANEALSTVIISPHWKLDYYDISTVLISPTREAFDALNTIAGHLKTLEPISTTGDLPKP